MPHFTIFKRNKPAQPQAGPESATPPAMKSSAGPSSNSSRISGRTMPPTDLDTLGEGFGRLSLSSKNAHGQSRRHENGRPTANGGDGFVGGILPPPPRDPDEMDWKGAPLGTPPRPPPPQGRTHAAPPMAFPIPQQYPAPGSLPTPPRMSMPEPQTMSRTMAHALAPGDLLGSSPPPPPKQNSRPPGAGHMLRPHSDYGALPTQNHLRIPPTTPPRPTLQTVPNSAPAKPISSGPSRPRVSDVQTPPRRQRAQSSPPSPISVSSSSTGKGGLKVQCCAMTKQDKRCTRRIPVSNALALLNGDEEPQYCHQHIKLAFVDVKYRSRKDPGKEVMYADWVPDYLQESTKTVLREEMQKEVSRADEPGYIYAYEIDDDTDPDVVHIKVGRAVKLAKRLAEWDKQCQSKQTHLRGFWPMTRDAEVNGMMRGRVQVGEPGPNCHRLERLVHLELADIALNAPYLDPDFPNVQADAGNGNKRAAARGPCPDCNAVHKEIFTFPRATGRYKGKEWESIVRPVIEKWGFFVEAYA